jgi:hypothetical protein
VGELCSLACEELKRIAAVVRYRAQFMSMNTTGLAHEA